VLPPQRHSLITETAQALRRALEQGQWRDVLPAERRLCEEWHISRPTLRAALEILAGEGLLRVEQGKRTRIIHCGRPEPAARPLTVCLLSPEPLHAMPPFVLLWVDRLRDQLAAAGHLLQVHVGRAEFGHKNPENALDSLTSSAPAAAWVLYQATEAMQRWFADRGVPCVVVGSLFPGVELPALDRDYRATCRHAVSLLANRGYRQLYLVLHEQRFGGDLESEAGFGEGLRACRDRAVNAEMLLHDGSPDGIARAVDGVLGERHGERPAFLVARTGFALSVCSHLLRRGCRIPEEAGILCRDDDQFLDHLLPRMARYSVNAGDFTRRLFRLVTQVMEREPRRRSGGNVMPEFVPRESI